MEHNAKILLADDSPTLRFLVAEVLTEAGFTVVEAEDGQDAVEKTYKENPDLLILDYDMPRKTGFEVVREIRSRTGYLHTPIIIFTADTHKSTKMEGLGLDIDDYLNKPADGDEIVARVKLLLKRNKQKMDSNPLTRLPGNPSIQARVESEIASKRPFAVLYCDLNNFKAYNDKYGFAAGDRVLTAVANIIVTAAGQDKTAFVGHIGGDDFIVIKPKPSPKALSPSWTPPPPLFITRRTAPKALWNPSTAKGKRNALNFYPLVLALCTTPSAR